MLQACSTRTSGTGPDTSLTSFRPIGMSTRDTCQTQKEIAAHNSVYDTLKTGSAVVYQAPCERGKKTKGGAEAKTS